MIYLLVMFCGVITLSAADDTQRQDKILKILTVPHLYNLTTISLPNHNLDDADFNTLLFMARQPQQFDLSHNRITRFPDNTQKYPSLTTLNLSNNSFTDEFPLHTCLCLFPKLKTLKINHNSVTALLESKSAFANKSLKIYEARGTQCDDINLGKLYNRLNLKTLDLSDSPTLTTFSGLNILDRKNNKKRPLQVSIRNNIISNADIDTYTKHAVVESNSTDNIKSGAIVGMVTLGFLGEVSCLFAEPHYCLYYPIPGNGVQALGNIFLTETPTLISSFLIGCLLGKAIAYTCLKNHGKQQAIVFVTGEEA